MDSNRCSGKGRISKESLLSTMGYKAAELPSLYSQTLSQEKRRRVLQVIEQSEGDFNRAAVLLGIKASSLKRWVKEWAKDSATTTDDRLTNPTRRFYEKIPSPWSVRAFDPATGEVCVEIRTPSTTNTLHYTIPIQRSSEY